MELDNVNLGDYKLKYTIDKIYDTFGDRVSVDKKLKSLIKFGRVDNLINVSQMVWLQGGIEELPTSDDIDSLVSTDGADTQLVKIEGHTLGDDGTLRFGVWQYQLNGTNVVTLDPPLIRATRIYNNDSTDIAGDVTVYQSGNNNVHLLINGDNNQSLKCAAALGHDTYWLITDIYCFVNRQNTRNVDFRIQTKEAGKVFRTILPPIAVSSNTGGFHYKLEQPLVVRPNSDIRVLAISSNTGNVGASVSINGFLAEHY